MKYEEIGAQLGNAEDEVRGLARALDADEKYRAGNGPNDYTRYLEGLFLEATGKWMALRAILDSMQAADEAKKGEYNGIHGF
jgi:hypothetical protein